MCLVLSINDIYRTSTPCHVSCQVLGAQRKKDGVLAAGGSRPLEGNTLRSREEPGLTDREPGGPAEGRAALPAEPEPGGFMPKSRLNCEGRREF